MVLVSKGGAGVFWKDVGYTERYGICHTRQMFDVRLGVLCVVADIIIAMNRFV